MYIIYNFDAEQHYKHHKKNNSDNNKIEKKSNKTFFPLFIIHHFVSVIHKKITIDFFSFKKKIIPKEIYEIA